MEYKRQARQIKLVISSDPGKGKIIRPVLATSTPRLRYHGVDPAHLVAIDLDVYLEEGERGYYRYSHTIPGKPKN